MNTKPINKWRVKGIGVAAWQHPKGYITYSFEKSYFDKNINEWKVSKILFREDLLCLAELAQTISNWELAGATPEGFRIRPSEEEANLPKIKVIETTKPSNITDDDDIPF